MKKLTLMLVVAFIGLTGCISNPPSKQALSVVIAGTNIAYEFEDGIEAKFIDQIQLTDAENKKIADALYLLEASKLRLRQYKENPLELISMLAEIENEAVLIKSAYREIFGIVNTHLSEYPIATQIKFRKFHASALVLNDEFESLTESIDASKNISTMLSIAETALKLAVLL